MGCKRWKTKSFKLLPMPNYPESRIKPSRTFARIALNYLAPITVKTEIGLKKGWVALLTCFTTRSVHLELVDDLTAEKTWKDEYLNSLRKRTQTEYKSPRCVENGSLSVGQVVLINDPRIPREVRQKNRSENSMNETVEPEEPIARRTRSSTKK
ncbi:unnamed protein product [Onchocerca ochengi]|uniref:DUF5641 domain-containing protein n=1 Tax=Onchocerca ochengi TaxID=42157 RepID=A0A182ETM8_ONCOC|nr:unnamed protein product [Onchocerca ochengi]